MANINVLAPFILSWEGGVSNNKNDSGGLTNKGVTLAVWTKHGRDINGDGVIDGNDLVTITDEDAVKIMKLLYWDTVKADKILSQNVANILVDWAWNSGVGRAAKEVQAIVGTTVDGIIGEKSIAAINAMNSEVLFKKIFEARLKFIDNIVASNPRNKVFEKGWKNRLNSIQYGKLVYNGGQKNIEFADQPTSTADVTNNSCPFAVKIGAAHDAGNSAISMYCTRYHDGIDKK